MWAVSRRTGLFIVSYLPLAAMFMVLKWPSGWSAAELGRLFVATLAMAGLALTVPWILTTKGRARMLVVLAAVIAAALVAVAGYAGWLRPFAVHTKHGTSSAAVSSLGACVVLLGLMIVALMFFNASQATRKPWTVSAPREQGSAVAGYLATYLLPLLAGGLGGWRVSAAYGIYFVVLWSVYVRSDNLVLINPTFYLMQYRIYEVTHRVQGAKPHDERVLLLIRRAIKDPAKVEVQPLGGDNYLARLADDR